MYPKVLDDLINSLCMLPGVGRKTAERYALAIISQQDDKILALANNIAKAKNSIKYCSICGNYSDNDICGICNDKNRDKTLICVVAYPRDIIALEKSNSYNGHYHVLNGLIAPSKNVMPYDLTIEQLTKKIDSNTKEIILALSPTLEGETTALYISKLLKDKVTLSRIAQGLPMGASIDYADDLTLVKAIMNRSKI